MQLHQPPREREAQAGPLDLVGPGADPPELLEDPLLILGSDADAGVADGDLDLVVDATRADLDAPAVRRELDRVGDQVDHDLLDLALVGDDRSQRRVDLDLDGDPVPAGPLLQQRPPLLQHVKERDGRSSSSIRPASTFARSSASLMSDSTCCPAPRMSWTDSAWLAPRSP